MTSKNEIAEAVGWGTGD